MIGYVTFRSITPAQVAESVLRWAGMACMIQRTPKWMAEQGCGYSLRLPQMELRKAVSLLRENHIQYRKIYIKKENGAYEEVSL